MGTAYSVSRIGTFDSCKLQYKYIYIDKLPSEVEAIEAFMGSRVHEALKEFYDFIKNRVVKPKEWLLSKYEELWHKNYTESIKIVKIELRPEDYIEKGRKCLADYYQEYYPFDQTKIVKTEESISCRIKHNDSEYSFRGVLDRLDWNDREKIFEIHDYKTSGTLMTQEEADRDIQLPLYQIALMSQWPEAERAKLVWHFLLFNKQIESSRTKVKLDALQTDIASRIKTIEECEEFSPTRGPLCDWCAYQEICPEWKHPIQMERLETNEYKKDPGVVLVARYAELEAEKKELRGKIVEIEAEQAKVEEAAIEFAEKEKIRVIDGPNHQLIVTIKEEISAPTRKEDEEKWQELRDVLIEENRFIEVSTINSNMLNSRIRNWPKEFYEYIKKFLIKREIKKVDLRNKP
jgi:putative RecB family exonuclease